MSIDQLRAGVDRDRRYTRRAQLKIRLSLRICRLVCGSGRGICAIACVLRMLL
jgi:hypothetical protein